MRKSISMVLIILLTINLLGITLPEATEVSSHTNEVASFEQSTYLPTEEAVVVSITYPEDAIYKGYKKDGGITHPYFGPITIEENCIITAVYSTTTNGLKYYYEDHDVTNIDKVIRVLEIEAYRTFNLESNHYNREFKRFRDAGYRVEVETQSIKEFVSRIEPINGNYDIVYIGALRNDGKRYSRFDGGPHGINVSLGGGSNQKSNGTIYEYYSGPDLTYKRGKDITEFIDSGQLFIVNDVFFDDETKGEFIDTKLYKVLNPYCNEEARDNHPSMIVFPRGRLKDVDIYDSYQDISNNKRPLMNLRIRPTEYTEISDGNYALNDSLELRYKFDIVDRTLSDGIEENTDKVIARLFIDDNGDGLFKANELVEEKKDISTGEDYFFNYAVDNHIGMMPWKIEIEDVDSGAKDYEIGYTVNKSKVETPIIRVLQINPPGNTYDLVNMKNNNIDLKREGEYEIKITKRSYTDLSNGDIELNGNYDMIILGFNDAFGYIDISETGIEDIKDFIKTGQGVMFTHDIFSYLPRRNDSKKNWSKNLTSQFRDMCGQNIYKYDYFNKDIVGTDNDDEYPVSSKPTVGYSRQSIDRELNNGSFSRTSMTHKMNDGFVTKYPYILPTALAVSETHHQYYQLDLEDEDVIPWFTLDNSYYNKYDARNDYYTYTKGNITYSGTGHKTPNVASEHEFFVNTMLKALKGANHAPNLEIIDLADNSYISINQMLLSFNMIAHDEDLADKVINRDIYIDFNGDGVYGDDERINHETSKVEVGTILPVNLDLEEIRKSKGVIPDDLDIKVVVYDDRGAEGVAFRHIQRISIPLIQLDVDSKGCLVGDSFGMDFTISADNYDDNPKYKDIRLKIYENNAITFNDNEEWTDLNDGIVRDIEDLTIVDGKSNWNSLSKVISASNISGNEVGEHRIKYKLSYSVETNKLKEEYFEFENEVGLHIKNGILRVQVVDDKKGRAIQGAKVWINKTEEGKTNQTGILSRENYSTGSYTIEVEAPKGYAFPSEYEYYDATTKRAKYVYEIDYDTSSKEKEFIVSGDCINSIRLKDLNNHGSTEVVRHGQTFTQLKFDLVRKTKDLSIDLYTDLKNSDINITSISKAGEVIESGDFALTVDNTISENGLYRINIRCEAELTEGIYGIKLLWNLGDNTLEPQQKRKIIVDKIKILEPSFDQDDTGDVYEYYKEDNSDEDNKDYILNLLVVKMPPIL